MIPCLNFIRWISLIFFGFLLPGLTFSAVSRGEDEVEPVHWMTDYADARELADRQDRMLLIFFRDAKDDVLGKRFET